MNDLSERPRSLALAVLTSAEDTARVRQLTRPYGVHAYTLQEFEDQHVVQRDANGRPVAVERSEILLGAVSTSSAATEILKGANDQLSLVSGLASFRPAALDGAGEEAFATWLAGRLLELSEVLAKDAVQLRRALAVLRREHDETLERYAELEIAVDLSTPRRVSKLSYDTGYWTVHLGPGAQQQVVQRLPVSPAGTALIELHLEPRDGGVSGELQAQLFAGGSPRPVYTWAFTIGGFKGGWFPLWLERALTAEGAGLRLELTWKPSGDEQLVLTLGHPTPLTEFSAQNQLGISLGAPLAVRVWGAPPGSRVSSKSMDAATGHSALGSAPPALAPQPVRIGLAHNELKQVRLQGPLATNPGFELVRFRPEQLDLLVHPVAHGATTAIVREIRIAEVQALSAIVLVDNKEARPVEFGLAIVPSQPVYADAAALVTRWTRVEPLTYAEVLGTVDQSSGESFDLLLATRMAEGADPHLAWAYFKRIEVLA